MIGLYNNTLSEPTMRIVAADLQKNTTGVDHYGGLESLGWIDLPFMVQQEEHPARGMRGSLAKDLPTDNVGKPCDFVPQRTDYEVVSFGWGDIPIAIEKTLFAETTNRHVNANGANMNNPATYGHPKKEASCHYGTHFCTNTLNHIPISSKPEHLSKFGWDDFPILSDAQESCLFSTTSKKKNPKEKHVRFSNVRIRTHTICFGDHPICDSYPISLDWEQQGEDQVVALGEFEESRGDAIRKLDFEERRSKLANALGLTLSQVDSLERERTKDFGPMGLPRTSSAPSIRPHPASEQTLWQ